MLDIGERFSHVLANLILVNAEHQSIENSWQVILVNLVALMRAVVDNNIFVCAATSLIKEGTRFKGVLLALLVAAPAHIRLNCCSSFSHILR